MSAFPDGWLATGDIATIDADGILRVVDRIKDVVKSGGEWISSLEIENIVSQHEAVSECAVIGARHPKWDERPVLFIVSRSSNDIDADTIREFLEGRIARWWMPDRIEFLTSLPRTGTGKVLKNELREQYRDILL